MTNLRCNTSKLNGSLGKKFNSSSVCQFCLNEESLSHFMFDCTKFNIDRSCWLEKVQLKMPHFKNLNDACKLNIVFNFSPQNSLYDPTINFITKSYKLRCLF